MIAMFEEATTKLLDYKMIAEKFYIT